MAINPSKLLGSASYISPRMSGGVFVPKKELIVVKNQVIEIKNLIKTSTLLKQAEAVQQRKTEEQERFKRREDELEKKTEPGTEKIKVPGLPKLGFLEGLKKFIFTVLLGRFIVKMLPQASKLTDVVKNIASGIEFATDFAGGLLNALATFVDKGYKAYDATRGFLKAVGGDNTLKLLDGFTKAIDATIIAAIALASMPDPFGPDKGPDIKEKAAQQVGSRFARRGLIRTFGRGGAKNILKFVRPFTKRLPIIGAFLDFGLSMALGESLGRAAFKSIGALLGSAVLGAAGSVIPVVGNFAGAVAGGFLGDQLGGSLYDLFFGGKIPQQKTVKAAGGGTPPATRGGKFVGGPAQRIIKKPKRAISGKVGALKPGADVGGKDKIERVFPSTKEKDKQVNPLGYIESSYKKMTSSKAFGGLMALPLKTLAGQTPTQLDYKVAAQGLNFWLNSTFTSDVKRGGVAGFAGGGEVNAAAFMSGEDMTNVIAKSLEDSVSNQLNDALNDLMKQLMLKSPVESMKEQEPTPGEMLPGSVPGGQLTMEQLVGLAKGAGFSTDEAVTMAAIAMAESGGNSNARNFTPPDKSYGLWQINMIGGLGPARLKEFGLNSEDQLFDPVTNAKAAYSVKKSSGFSSWTVYKTGKYKTHLAAAQAARSAPSLATSPMNFGAVGYSGYITGDPSSPNYDPSHGGGNYHDHLSFRDRATAERAYNFFTSKGFKVTEFMGYGAGVTGPHSGMGSLHHSGLAFDIPGSQVPVGQETRMSARVRATLAQFNSGKTLFGGGPTGKGGLTMTHPGEYIIDKDSVDAFGINFFDIVNKVENMSQRQQAAKQLMGILQFYAGYESGGRQRIKVRIPASQTTVVPVPVPVGGGMMVAGGGSGTRPQDVTYRG